VCVRKRVCAIFRHHSPPINALVLRAALHGGQQLLKPNWTKQGLKSAVTCWKMRLRSQAQASGVVIISDVVSDLVSDVVSLSK